MNDASFKAMYDKAEQQAVSRARGGWITTHMASAQRSIVHGGQSAAAGFGKQVVGAAATGAAAAGIMSGLGSLPLIAFLAETVVSEALSGGLDAALEVKRGAHARKSGVDKEQADLKKDAIGTIDRNITKLRAAKQNLQKAQDTFVQAMGRIPRDETAHQAAAFAVLREWHECQHYLVKLQLLTKQLNESTRKLGAALDAFSGAADIQLNNFKRLTAI